MLPTSRRPRVLYVTRHIPYIPGPAGTAYSYRLLQAISDVAETTMICAGDTPDEVAARRAGVEALCADIVAGQPPQRRQRMSAFPRRMVDMMTLGEMVITGDAYLPARFDRRSVLRVIRSSLKQKCFDLIVVEYTELAMIARPVVSHWHGPAIAFLQNVDSVYQKRLDGLSLNGQHSSGLHLASRARIRALEHAERDILSGYSTVSVVSDIDAAHLAHLRPDASLMVTPVCVDVDYLMGMPHQPTTPPVIVFTGSLWYPPNIDGLGYLCDEIWPLIHEQCPAARLLIAGNDPPAEVLTIADRVGASVHASVPDMRPYLAQSVVSVVPLRLGSGARVKIIEALGAGCPVVSTTLGAEGLRLLPGRDILLADTPTEFATAVVALLNAPSRAADMAAHGQAIVRAMYNWQDERLRVARFIEQLAG